MINKFIFPTITNTKFAFYLLISGLFLGTIIRFIMIFFFVEFDFTQGDTANYIENARNIIEFGIYGIKNEPTVYRPPLYSFFVATTMYFFGNNIFPIQIIQIIFGLYLLSLLKLLKPILFNKETLLTESCKP